MPLLTFTTKVSSFQFHSLKTEIDQRSYSCIVKLKLAFQW